MKILIDVNLSPDWVHYFAAAGIHATHWSSIGIGDAPDEEIVAYALLHDYAVFTQDLDYGTILALTSAGKPSVIQVRCGDTSPQAIGQLVLRGLREESAALADGAVLTIEKERIRLRLLPFHAV